MPNNEGAASPEEDLGEQDAVHVHVILMFFFPAVQL